MTAFFHQTSPVALRFMCGRLPAIARIASPVPDPPRGHGVPRLLVADGSPPRALRCRLRAHQRGRGRLSAPPAPEPTGGRNGAGAGGPRDRPLVPPRLRGRRPLRGGHEREPLRRLPAGARRELRAGGGAVTRLTHSTPHKQDNRISICHRVSV